MEKPNTNVIRNIPCTHVNGTNYNLRCRKKHTTYKSTFACQCHHCITEIFSEFVDISTPKSKSSVKKLSCHNQITFLPRLICSNKKTVVLDLDKTLIHSVPENGENCPKNYDFVVKPLFKDEIIVYYVLKRPFVDEFLRFLSKSDFEIVVFTAGAEDYASRVLDTLDPDGLISHRLYRDSCKNFEGHSIKDLSNLGRDLKKVVIVDDKPNSYRLQPENGVPIIPFVDDLGDEELKKLMNGFFTKCHEFEDMRDVVKHYFGKS